MTKSTNQQNGGQGKYQSVQYPPAPGASSNKYEKQSRLPTPTFGYRASKNVRNLTGDAPDIGSIFDTWFYTKEVPQKPIYPAVVRKQAKQKGGNNTEDVWSQYYDYNSFLDANPSYRATGRPTKTKKAQTPVPTKAKGQRSKTKFEPVVQPPPKSAKERRLLQATRDFWTQELVLHYNSRAMKMSRAVAKLEVSVESSGRVFVMKAPTRKDRGASLSRKIQQSRGSHLAMRNGPGKAKKNFTKDVDDFSEFFQRLFFVKEPKQKQAPLYPAWVRPQGRSNVSTRGRAYSGKRLGLTKDAMDVSEAFHRVFFIPEPKQKQGPIYPARTNPSEFRTKTNVRRTYMSKRGKGPTSDMADVGSTLDRLFMTNNTQNLSSKRNTRLPAKRRNLTIDLKDYGEEFEKLFFVKESKQKQAPVYQARANNTQVTKNKVRGLTNDQADLAQILNNWFDYPETRDYRTVSAPSWAKTGLGLTRDFLDMQVAFDRIFDEPRITNRYHAQAPQSKGKKYHLAKSSDRDVEFKTNAVLQTSRVAVKSNVPQKVF